MSTERNQEAVSKIIAFLQESEPKLLLIGAGLSSPVYPSWEDLVLQLCNACLPDKKIKRENVREESKKKKYIEECISANQEKYFEIMKEIFCENKHFRRQAYEEIAMLPVNGFLTLNFDNELESYLNKKSIGFSKYIYPKLRNISQSGKLFLYLHGSVKDDPSNLVFGKNEFEKAYNNDTSSILKRFLETLFLTNTFFLGVNLEEENVLKALKWNRDFIASTGEKIFLRHIWLAPSRLPLRLARDKDSETYREIESSLKTKFEDFGVKVVFYDPIDRLHSGFDDILIEVNRVLQNQNKTQQSPWGNGSKWP